MPTHLNMRYAEIEALWPGIQAVQDLANQYGIPDISADNGIKVLQLVVATGLDVVPGRMGADYKDRMGNVYESKTMNTATKATGFSTNHHLTTETIAKYRTRRWVFSLYDNLTLLETYLLDASDMEPIFQKWETALSGSRTHLNNPKVPVDFVRETGTIMYMKDVAPAWINGKKKAVAA